MKRNTSTAVAALVAMLLAFACGCEKDRSQLSDAELGLNARQARGRRIFNVHCAVCHPAYSSHGNKGPGLKNLYGKEYLPSGLTASDEHVEQSIVDGRNMMPGFPEIGADDLADLVAYLHTL